jgi:hypothetical protein
MLFLYDGCNEVVHEDDSRRYAPFLLHSLHPFELK